MAETYSAGVVTAYGAAVRGGYTGTYEEFCAEQAEFAENAAAVAQAKEDVETMQGQVEQTAATFVDTTVPAAVATVQAEGATQVQAVQSEGTMQAAAVETVGAQQTAAVEAAGSDAVDAVEAAETAATGAVTAAQTAAVQAVTTAQSTAVSAVQAESATQLAAIQTKGEQTIASIPEDYTALSDDVANVKSALGLEIIDKQPDVAELLGTSAYPFGWRNGSYNSTTGAVTSSDRYIRTLTGGDHELVAPENALTLYAKAPTNYYVAVYEYDSNGTYIMRHGVANNLSADGTNEIDIEAVAGHIYKLCVGMFESGAATNYLTEEFINQIVFKFRVREVESIAKIANIILDNTANYSIRCAKETNYSDGTRTTVEWYLIEDKDENFYITKDFYSGKFLFSADFNTYLYKFGVLPNGDIIVVYRNEVRASGSSDNNRKNPFVYLASEGWAVKHIVDFGTSLKPCGWLENCGFCPMPNGDTLFCEYTRPSVETSNCWKISGDPTLHENWVVKKTFALSGEPNAGFKHCHAVNYDFYNDVYYLCTGDDDVGAQVWYSSDDGNTWTQARSASEKYCRMLNMIFTKDYIYWASDTSASGLHYLFRCARDQNGIIDYTTIAELADLYVSGVATYGTAYLQELNALVILDKCDTAKTSMPFRVYDIASAQLHTIDTFYSSSGNAEQIGFRTEYSEFQPSGNYVLCGFGKRVGLGYYSNYIKGLGNATTYDFPNMVNNLRILVYKTSTGYGCALKTAFMPR